MYKFVVSDGDRRENVKWLTCLTLAVVRASQEGRKHMGRIGSWKNGSKSVD